ncbi:hypothetical protein LQG66_03855 [Bradyrhizobium ontarionense]|uniref:Uncharacterized protein n=1 Tax=Bradyrhizobium ontarionense TaxID=2898149 RepID=A0ABY3RDJ7_9BRAD|nr:hypothetical protein [Bradyrhizobium sp. A19]UFZ05461.1 hypothetical protein LQG66_03855 [Bradyrhizobium sp. A19]
MAKKTIQLPLGKTAARAGAMSFKLSDYIDKKALPKPPKQFGHEGLVPASWGMLGNDRYGDCVWAGAAHETMMWNAEAGRKVAFTDAGVLSDYSAVTGFNPRKPSTDNGTDMQVAASYRRKTGIVDAGGKRHPVAAYLAIEPGNINEHMTAVYLFGAVGIGISFPASAMDQFNAGKPWDVVSRTSIEGCHYIPLVARREQLDVVTWGRLQAMTPRFFQKYNDESVAYVSLEALTKNKSPEGFDAAQLQADLAALGK